MSFCASYWHEGKEHRLWIYRMLQDPALNFHLGCGMPNVNFYRNNSSSLISNWVSSCSLWTETAKRFLKLWWVILDSFYLLIWFQVPLWIWLSEHICSEENVSCLCSIVGMGGLALLPLNTQEQKSANLLNIRTGCCSQCLRRHELQYLAYWKNGFRRLRSGSIPSCRDLSFRL